MTMFLFEALLLGFGATVLGGLLGALIAWAVNAAQIEIPSLAVQCEVGSMSSVRDQCKER